MRSSLSLLLLMFVLAYRPLFGTCPDTLERYLSSAQQQLQSPTLDSLAKEGVIQDLLRQAQRYRQASCHLAMGRVWSLVGVYRDFQQQNDSAYAYYLRALSPMQRSFRLDDSPKSRKDSIHFAVLLHNCSRMYRAQEKWASALALDQQSLDLRMMISGRPRLGVMLTSIGYINGELGRSQEARSFYHRALQYYLSQEGGSDRAYVCHWNLCASYAGDLMMDSARYHFQQVQGYPDAYQARFDTYFNMGNAYLRLGVLDSARQYTQQAHRYLQSCPPTQMAPTGYVNIDWLRGAVYAAQGRWRQSLEALRQSQAQIGPRPPSRLSYKLR